MLVIFHKKLNIQLNKQPVCLLLIYFTFWKILNFNLSLYQFFTYYTRNVWDYVTCTYRKKCIKKLSYLIISVLLLIWQLRIFHKYHFFHFVYNFYNKSQFDYWKFWFIFYFTIKVKDCKNTKNEIFFVKIFTVSILHQHPTQITMSKNWDITGLFPVFSLLSYHWLTVFSKSLVKFSNWFSIFVQFLQFFPKTFPKTFKKGFNYLTFQGFLYFLCRCSLDSWKSIPNTCSTNESINEI